MLSGLADFRKTERATKKQTQRRFSKEIKFYEKNFNLACEIEDFYLNKYRKKPPPNKVTPLVMMYPRLLLTAKAIVDLNLNGNYYDASILWRTFFENLGLCTYLARNETQIGDWIEGKRIAVSCNKLFHELNSFLVSNPTKELASRTNEIYGIASSYVHSGFKTIYHSFLLMRKNKSAIWISTRPIYRSKEFGKATFESTLLLNLVSTKLLEDELPRKFLTRL